MKLEIFLWVLIVVFFVPELKRNWAVFVVVGFVERALRLHRMDVVAVELVLWPVTSARRPRVYLCLRKGTQGRNPLVPLLHIQLCNYTSSSIVPSGCRHGHATLRASGTRIMSETKHATDKTLHKPPIPNLNKPHFRKTNLVQPLCTRLHHSAEPAKKIRTGKIT